MISPSLAAILDMLEDLPEKTQEHVAEILRVYLARLREGVSQRNNRHVVHTVLEIPATAVKNSLPQAVEEKIPLSKAPPPPWGDRISIDPDVLGGRPAIKGTLLAVEFIIDLLARGWSELDIIRAYPGIEREDILACLQYAGAVMKGKTLPGG